MLAVRVSSDAIQIVIEISSSRTELELGNLTRETRLASFADGDVKGSVLSSLC
jgi:hypothetical protein